MTVLAFALLVLAVAAMVVVHRRLVAVAVARLEVQFVAREVALARMAKESVRETARAVAAAEQMTAEHQALQRRTRSLHVDVQQILCDPKIQAVLEREAVNG